MSLELNDIARAAEGLEWCELVLFFLIMGFNWVFVGALFWLLFEEGGVGE